MTFTYQFEPADWIAFITHHLKNSPIHRRRRFCARLGVLGGVLIFGLIIFLWQERNWGLAALFLMAGVVTSLGYPSVYDDSIMKRMKKLVDHPDNARVFGRQTVTFTPEGIHAVGPGTESTIAWERIIKAEEGPDHVFLYLSVEGAIAIPRRSLEGASFEDVKKQLQQYVGRRSQDH